MDSTTPFQNIVVATDFSDCSRDAVAVAVELASTMQANLTVVHVWQVTATGAIGLEYVPIDFVGMVEDASRKELDALVAKLRETLPTVQGSLCNGVAWDQIIDVARRRKADLLVLGTHGRTGLKHVLLGSVAEKVVRLAPCAVLTVPLRHPGASPAPKEQELRT